MERLESHIADGNVTLYSHFVKTVWWFPIKLNICLAAIPLQDTYLIETQIYVHIKICTHAFTESLFIIMKTENNANVL